MVERSGEDAEALSARAKQKVYMKSSVLDYISKRPPGSVMSELELFCPRAVDYLRDLLFTLVGRDMKLRYKRSILGIAWSLLTPLAQLAVFYLTFDVLLPLNIPNYLAFLFSGVLVWNWFQGSLYQATSTIVDNRELIKRPGFPAAILPTVTVASHLIHFLAGAAHSVCFSADGRNPVDERPAGAAARDCDSIHLDSEPGLFHRHFLCHFPRHPAPSRRAPESVFFSYPDLLQVQRSACTVPDASIV